MSPIDFIKDSMFHVLNASHTHFDYEQDFHLSFKSSEKSSSNKKNNLMQPVYLSAFYTINFYIYIYIWLVDEMEHPTCLQSSKANGTCLFVAPRVGKLFRFQ